MIDNLWIHRVGVEGNRIRIDPSEEFSLDICAARVLQQVQKTGIHRKRAMTIGIKYSNLGELPIKGFPYFRDLGTEDGCEIVSSRKRVRT